MPKTSKSAKKRAQRIKSFISLPYESFTEAMLRGEPYNEQVMEFIRNKEFHSKHERAVALVLEGKANKEEVTWETAVKLVCDVAYMKGKGILGSPTAHDHAMGLRASMLKASFKTPDRRPVLTSPPKLRRQRCGQRLTCCKCPAQDSYTDLQDAYDHGWFAQDDSYFCPNHAYKAIVESDL